MPSGLRVGSEDVPDSREVLVNQTEDRRLIVLFDCDGERLQRAVSLSEEVERRTNRRALSDDRHWVDDESKELGQNRIVGDDGDVHVVANGVLEEGFEIVERALGFVENLVERGEILDGRSVGSA